MALEVEHYKIIKGGYSSTFYIGLRQCCRASKLVCRILIPEVAGGPRLRDDARPWIIMMALSVYHADKARTDFEVEY